MGSYTFGRMDLTTDTGHIRGFDANERRLPRHQLSARTYWNIRPDLQWDNMFYYVDGIGAPADSYLRYDTRLGWHVTPGVELSFIGRNLLESRYAEWPNGFNQAYINRSFVGRIAIDF